MLLSFLVALTLVSQAAPAPSAAAPLTREQMSQFLQTAKVVSKHGINKGITNPIRLTLSDGTITHDAAFTYVDQHRAVMQLESGRTEIDFVDSYKYTLAAYALAEILGVDDMMPVTVAREWDNQPGALSWWLDTKFDEGERLKRKIEPPDQDAWGRQTYRMRVFSALVADTDRNAGNILIGQDWKLWMIDFTRAFRRFHDLQSPQTLNRCDSRLLGRLRSLTASEVASRTTPYLSTREIEALMARRDAIVALFDRMVAAKGEGKVLY
jgi:hypothetical protein